MLPRGVPVLGRSGRLKSLCAGLAAALTVLSGATFAAEPFAHDFATYRPSLEAVRIDPKEAPTIDADLSDPAWAKAHAIEEFYQLDPDTGRPASERTILRVLYDEDNLYVGVYCYDREPDKLIALVKTRDGNIGQDDFIRLYIDPAQTRRNSYIFEINSLGARGEALGQNNVTLFKEWNMIWSVKARRVEDGWIAEIAIPFRGLSYDPAQKEWGFEFHRNIRRKGERARWAGISPSAYFVDVSREGTLTGIHDLRRDLGLDLQLYARATYRHDWQVDDGSALLGALSGNAYYRITPALTGTLTVNPDFSNTPLDQRQVNTTRFALFQPETREFFLQDVAAFEFGGFSFEGADNARPFFSRNIGLANKRAVSVIGGGKVSGEYGGFGIGALSVLTSGTGHDKRGQVLSVARVTRAFDESRLGVIFTNGNPNGDGSNSVVGADFQFRESNWFAGQTLISDVFYERSMSAVVGDDDTFGVGIDYPNEPWDVNLRVKQVGRNFFPALGFVNRAGIRAYDGQALYRDRTLGWRWFDAGTSFTLTTGLNNQIQSRENAVWTGVNTGGQHQYYLKAFETYELVPDDNFKLVNKVPVPKGRYSWITFAPRFDTNPALAVSASLDLFCCRFYNGNYFKADAQIVWKAGGTWNIGPRYAFTHIALPTGTVDIHVVSADFTWAFTPDMALLAQLQYDNISQAFSLAARYRWEYEPGQEIFVSLGQSALIPGTRFEAQTSQLNVRLGRTLRF